MTVRQPLGVAGLIIAANTPIANVAWKVFPALLCGNGAVLKASEDTPETALAFARLAAEAGLPEGVLNVLQGYGEEAGHPLVEDQRVAVVSFTASTGGGRVGRAGLHRGPAGGGGGDPGAGVSGSGVFGPVGPVHRVRGFAEAVQGAGRSAYGLTAAIWRAGVHRGQEFVARVQSGVAS